MLSLYNLSCISFNIVSIGLKSWVFYLAASIGIIKGWSWDFVEDDDNDDDDDDKVDEKVDFDDSPTIPLGAKENKIWEIFVICWFRCWREWFI